MPRFAFVCVCVAALLSTNAFAQEVTDSSLLTQIKLIENISNLVESSCRFVDYIYMQVEVSFDERGNIYRSKSTSNFKKIPVSSAKELPDDVRDDIVRYNDLIDYISNMNPGTNEWVFSISKKSETQKYTQIAKVDKVKQKIECSKEFWSQP